MSEQRLDVSGGHLAWEGFGTPGDPVVLLIAGQSQSMTWWDAEFCSRLAAGGRYVVRYDHRDTGRSSTSPAGSPTYTWEDLCLDPVRLLDALGVGRAHLVGLSMGGGIAQLLALIRPDHVETLVLVDTSPATSDDRRELPPPEPQVLATFENPDPEPDWSDRDAVIAYRVAIERPYAGGLGFDEERYLRLATEDVDRTTDMAAALTNHQRLEGGPSPDNGIDAITAPTLVLHGTTDPLFPYAHGEALRDAIPGARLMALEGGGHQQPPPPLWAVTIAAILEHTS